MPALLVDLGGTHLRCGLEDDGQRVHVIRKIRIRNDSVTGGSRIWEDIIGIISEFAEGSRNAVPEAAPIVISFPGPVEPGRGIVDAPTVTGGASNLPDLRAILVHRTGRDVHILNDISAAAWRISQTLSAARFMVVTVSSGIGSKIFDRRHPKGVLDDVIYAGEIGHVTVDETPDAPVCDCGGRGHLGAIASGRGVERHARREASRDPLFMESACVAMFGATPQTLTNERQLVPAARLQDPWALAQIRACTEPLARVLLAAVVAAGIERVVIIGGFALSLADIYRTLLRDSMMKRCDYRILQSRLEDLIVMGEENACLLGAAVYAACARRP